jgi:hypothetical protein
MPSLQINYVPGSGFVPLVSGVLGSGLRQVPVGGCQIVADINNSGSIYISISGGNPASGIYGTLVGSGGPTITSGGSILSGRGQNDGMRLSPGASYFIPKIAMQTGPMSGSYTICVGADPTCSGPYARVYWEMF